MIPMRTRLQRLLPRKISATVSMVGTFVRTACQSLKRIDTDTIESKAHHLVAPSVKKPPFYHRVLKNHSGHIPSVRRHPTEGLRSTRPNHLCVDIRVDMQKGGPFG